ncbi:MAG: cytochrome c [Deltaproteobacteria bacterium]|nr:cytochrome c [Deltaproteobacteria bacterium]
MKFHSRFLALFVTAMFLVVSVSALAADDPLEKLMKGVGKSMKTIKAAVQGGQTAGIAEAANFIAAEVLKSKDHDPPQAKDRKAEIPALSDECAAAAKALAAATTPDDVQAKYKALGASCKKCHDIFQPEE